MNSLTLLRLWTTLPACIWPFLQVISMLYVAVSCISLYTDWNGFNIHICSLIWKSLTKSKELEMFYLQNYFVICHDSSLFWLCWWKKYVSNRHADKLLPFIKAWSVNVSTFQSSMWKQDWNKLLTWATKAKYMGWIENCHYTIYIAPLVQYMCVILFHSERLKKYIFKRYQSS